MAATTWTLIQLLLILFVFDIVRKIYFQPKDLNKNANSFNENQKIRKDNILPDEDDEIETKKIPQKDNIEKEEEPPKNNQKSQNNKKILIINYDKYLYEKNFNKLKYEIENNYTNIIVEGKEYPLPKNKVFFSRFIYIAQIGVSLLLISQKIIRLGFPFLSENRIKIIEDYKWIIILSNFFIHFWINKFILTTGAFEIFYNDNLLYSKLETHLLPRQPNIIQIIKSLHLKAKVEEDF